MLISTEYKIYEKKERASMNEENDQGKIIMYQLLQAELGELRKQIIMADNRLIDLETTEHAIKEMQEFKGDKDTLVPLGAGIYAQGDLKKRDVILDIGAGIMVNRDLKSAKIFLDKRRKDIDDAKKKIELQIENITKNINELTPEIEEIVRESQHKHQHK